MSPPQNIAERHIVPLVATAANQDHWPPEQHQALLDEIAHVLRPIVGDDLTFPFDAQGSSRYEPSFVRAGLSCSEDPDMFYHDADQSPPTEDREKARQLCLACPLLKQCLDNVLDKAEGLSGVWGGQTRVERFPEWKRRVEERKRIRGAAYDQVRHVVGNLAIERLHALPYAQRRSFKPQIISLRKGVAASAELPDSREVIFSEALEVLNEAPQLAERLSLLAPPFIANYLKVELGMLRGDILCDSDTKIANLVGATEATYTAYVSVAKREIPRIMAELIDGTFDYQQWAERYSRSDHHIKSALLLLAKAGIPIPKDASEAELREIARCKLSSLQLAEAAKQMVIDAYGLECTAKSLQELAAEKGLDEAAARGRINYVIKQLKRSNSQ